MSDLKAQVSEAVKAALSPGPSQADAYKFLEDVKTECVQTWQACLEIFLAGGHDGSSGQWIYSYAPEARMFGLQVVDDVLSNRFDTISSESALAVQAGLLDYVRREYQDGQAEGQLFYLRNKVVHTLFLLFMQTYTTTWPNFFEAFFAMLPSSNSSEAFNVKTTDLVLRLLHETSTEISDSTLRLNKAHARLTRDTELRDAIRVKDAAIIASQTIRILVYAMQHLDSPSSQITTQQAAELAEMSMRVLADFASWIDISFIVTPSFLPLLFQCLGTARAPIRLASAELLFELVTKGMSPADKLELLRVLNVSDVISQLLTTDDERKKSGSEEEQDELYREKLGRVLNVLGLEFTRIAEEASATDEQKETAKSAALSLRPLALRFLGDEYDDTSVTVIPFLQSIMALYKKEKKRAAQTHLTQEKAEFLVKMLEATFSKLRYFTDDEWGGDDDDEDGDDEVVTAFLEMRKNLKMLFDAVAWIDFDLFSNSVRQLIVSTLDSVDSGSSNLDWKDVELALHVLYIYGEPAAKEKGTSGMAALVQVPTEELKKAKTTPDHKINFANYPASTLGELMMRTIQSNVAAWPHPAVPLQYFECISRYHEFFNLAPQTIMTVLPVFLDERGLHQEKQSTRSRCFYLFNRFISTAKLQLMQSLNAAAVTDICARIGDLLTIEATLPPPETPGEDILTKAATHGSPFDSQLYLFEALGTLMSMLNNEADRQVELLQALLQPLLQDIQSTPSSTNDPAILLRLHHLIKAAGNVAYGFPELKNVINTPDGQWVLVLQEAMRIILAALKTHNRVAIIREASLGAFKSTAARIGEAVLPLVGTLIDCLVDELTASELVDFLPFIGMLVHRYKERFAEMLDVLLNPVFDRVYFFLEQPVTGTDDIVQHSELRRAYFNLLLSIANANMQSVFASPRNAPRLEQLLGSIPHYISNGALLLDQKVGFAVINRLVQTWITSTTATNGASESSLPQFKDFVYERVVPLGLQLPVRQNFDYSDAQAYQVIGEVAILYKTLLNLRGNEFADYLASNVFVTLGMPKDASDAFLYNLAQASDGRQFKKWLSAFLQNAKKSTNDKPYSVAHLLQAVPTAGPR